jgi:D-galactose 1-dehydrogenase
MAALTDNPGWRIVGAADIQPGTASILPVNVPFFSSTTTLLHETSAEVCLVATGHASHFEIGKQVLESGRHLIVEKPCCAALGQLEDLIALAAANDRVLVSALHAAYGLDLLWFLSWPGRTRLGCLTGFQCRFYDPYVENGRLLEAGRSLGGSWLDSGINALSVLATIIPPTKLSIMQARFPDTSVEGCRDIYASVEFGYETDGCHHGGTIETHWALGRNSKSTLLKYGHSDTEVLLDHTQESVSIYHAGMLADTIDLRNGRPRLVNHYDGVFADAHRRILGGEPNSGHALSLHRLLFAAAASREIPDAGR